MGWRRALGQRRAGGLLARPQLLPPGHACLQPVNHFLDSDEDEDYQDRGEQVNNNFNKIIKETTTMIMITIKNKTRTIIPTKTITTTITKTTTTITTTTKLTATMTRVRWHCFAAECNRFNTQTSSAQSAVDRGPSCPNAAL